MPPVLEDTQQVNGQHTFEKESDEFVKLVAQVAALEERCARVWDASLRERRQYRQLRRVDPQAAREFIEFIRQDRSTSGEEKTLIQDLDRFFDGACSLYLAAGSELRVEIRSLMQSHKRLLRNLHGYAGRAAIKLKRTGNPECLLRGLAAASMDEGRTCQEYGHVLGMLYKNALDRGLEPSQFFSLVSKLSGNEMRSALENFESSKDFAIFVRPYIGGRRT